MQWQDNGVGYSFLACMLFVFEQECRRLKDGKLDDGYVFDPDDPGGETKYGISKRAHPDVDVKNLTVDDAIRLYYDRYWPVAAGLKFPLNVCVFDTAVNQGIKRAKKYLQLSEGDWKKYINIRVEGYIKMRDGAFKNNPSRDRFFRFWMSRIRNLRKFIDEKLMD